MLESMTQWNQSSNCFVGLFQNKTKWKKNTEISLLSLKLTKQYMYKKNTFHQKIKK